MLIPKPSQAAGGTALAAFLRQGLAHAVRWQMVIRNPADAVDPPKVERGAMTTYDMG